MARRIGMDMRRVQNFAKELRTANREAEKGSDTPAGGELALVDHDEAMNDVTVDLDSRIKQARILIVDDSSANVMLLESILHRDGYDNVQATTDPRVVTALHQRNIFDLILLDIRMPHMDGFDVMRALRDTTGEEYIPVLVLTAQTDDATRLQALELGAMDYLTKPFSRVEALHRIRNMLKVRTLYNIERWQAEVLEHRVRDRTRELNDTRLEVIRRLGRAGEYRDNETGFHVIRMSKSCQRLAGAMGLDEAQCDVILQASPMHDLGKIGIPDSILLKPGKLSADEWVVMKTHTTIGAQILGGNAFDIMQVARDIAMNHHERWDGGGYPNGVSGEDIPQAARIATVCDVFDALLSERPYKEPWSLEKTLEFMKAGAGTMFDPNILPRFLDVLDDIQEIRQSYADEQYET